MDEPITTILDARLPQPWDYAERLPASVAVRALALSAERGACTDERVDEIDRALIELLRPYTW